MSLDEDFIEKHRDDKSRRRKSWIGALVGVIGILGSIAYASLSGAFGSTSIDNVYNFYYRERAAAVQRINMRLGLPQYRIKIFDKIPTRQNPDPSGEVIHEKEILTSGLNRIRVNKYSYRLRDYNGNHPYPY